MSSESSSDNVGGSIFLEPRLPPELMLEIASSLLHHPHAYIAESVERIAQIRTGRALSQSCRLFRNIFLPHLWSHLDTFFSQGDAIELQRRMHEITQAQWLLDHVKTISVSLHGPSLSSPELVAAFIACMSACPNLDALKIVLSSLRVDRPPTNMPGAFDYLHTAFHTHSFPSVRMIVLPDILSKILPSFPHVRNLLFGPPTTTGYQLIRDAKRYCPHLEEVCYEGSSRMLIGWIALSMPDIQRLILRNSLFREDFVFMRTLTNLCYLELGHREDENQRYPPLDECVEAARELLSISRNPKPKKIRIKTLVGLTDSVLKETVIDLP